MMRRVVLVLALAAAACSRQPRSAAYFEAHGEEAVRVTARCANGGVPGRECDNARVGLAARDRQARMSAYHRNF